MELAGLLWTGCGGQGVVGDVMSANLTASKASTNEAKEQNFCFRELITFSAIPMFELSDTEHGVNIKAKTFRTSPVRLTF